MRKPSKQELLEHYAQNNKEAQRFLQVDGWHEDGRDNLFCPDQDGDVLSAGIVHELRTSSWPVRVLIHENAKKEDVLRMLPKILKWLESDFERSLQGL